MWYAYNVMVLLNVIYCWIIWFMVKWYCEVMKGCNLMNDSTLASAVKEIRDKINMSQW